MKLLFKSTLLSLLAALALLSCGDKNYYDWESGQRQIILSSRVTLEAQPRLQDLQIEQGQGLSLFITPAGTTSEILYPNVNIIANGQGGFAGETMYYPVDGRNIDLYAIHPYSINANLSSAVNFSVKTDQSDKTNFLNSDLLHAVKINQPRTDAAVSMLFAHKLAKVDITIETTDGIDLSTLNTVAILNTKPETAIEVVSGDIAEATGSTLTITAYGVAGSPDARASVSAIHAIVVPQTIPSNTALFRFIIGQQSYVYTTTQPFTFVGGSQHEVKLTLSGDQISLESEIKPWEDGASIGGGVTPESPSQ